MKTFLDKVAEEVLKDGRNDISDLCVVVPNRRASVFFRKGLARVGTKAIWAPTVVSIEDFAFQLSGMVKIDRTNLLFTFYEVYRKQVNDPQSLELFASWAPTFLSDANEVDLNLIDAQDIYTQLHSIERIARWNPQQSEPTDLQKRHLDFVAKLFGFYTSLREVLEAKGLAYQGMAFRKVAEQVESVIARSEWKKVVFAGFNALTVAEERIISAWVKSGNAELLWDTDSFYVDDPVHEAGHYIRKYMNGSSDLKIGTDYKWKGDSLSSGPKKVNLIAVQRGVAQAQVAASILSEKLAADPDYLFTKTAVILNDEKLLMPLLHALPVELKGVNITMGYGIENSQTASFIEKLFKLYEQFAENDGRFYHGSVSSILTDTLYLVLNKEGADQLRDSIIKQKRVFLTPTFLATDTLNEALFSEGMITVQGFLIGLKNIIKMVHEKLEEAQELQIEMEFLFLFDKMVLRLGELITEYGSIETVKTLHSFWRQMVRGEKLDFVGEPLSGLQIMGMLETRNLDFEEVIILGVNEGHLPSSSHSNSYFTFDIRKVFGLACQNERDAVTGYHFYRLLQRAQNVHLVFDQDTDSFGRGEVSRYVRQLKMEKGKNIDFLEWNVKQEIPNRPFAVELSIPKDAAILQKIESLGEYGFSPSALNTYRSCSLKYYFKYVAGFKEQQELTEEVDHAVFGTAVHGALEELYKPFLNKPLSEELLRSIKPNTETILKTRFNKELALDGELEGRNLLAFKVGLTYVNRVIDADIKTIKDGNVITPIGFEVELLGKLHIDVNGLAHEASVKGWADRVDRLSDGTIRLIDYKTGSFTGKTRSIKSVEAFEKPDADHAFQLLMYAFMYNHEHKDSVKLRPMVFYLRSKEVEYSVQIMEDGIELEGADLISYAKERLEETLCSIYDQEVLFTQTENLKICQYCDFNQVCQR